MLEWGDLKLLITDMAFNSFQYCIQYDQFALTNVIITYVKFPKLQLDAGTRNFLNKGLLSATMTGNERRGRIWEEM